MNHLKPDDVIAATIASIEPYGLWCQSEENTVLVLRIETEIDSRQPLEAIYSVGETVHIRILRFNEQDNAYSGSLICKPA